MKSLEVKEFYSNIKFPGAYTICDIKFYKNYKNNFLEPYINGTKFSKNVLDIGCGTGFITNLLAFRYPHLKIDAIDFSDSIDVAINFSKQHNLKNVKYHKVDFFDYSTHVKYDTIISNGVLHHMPDYIDAFKKIQKLSPNKIIIGLYNRYGKILNKYVKFRSQLLHDDQLCVPYEVSFYHNQVLELLQDYECQNVYPSVCNKFVNLSNLFNRNNGGLTVYTFSQKP